MNHHWHNNRCTKCGITRKRKKVAKAIHINPAVTSQGELVYQQKAKVVNLWSYNGSINRPDCPDELFGKAA